MEINPVLPIAGQKFTRYFEGYLEFFAVFRDFLGTRNDVLRNPGWETLLPKKFIFKVKMPEGWIAAHGTDEVYFLYRYEATVWWD